MMDYVYEHKRHSHYGEEDGGICDVCILRADLDKANARITALAQLLQDTLYGRGKSLGETFNIDEARKTIAALAKP